MRLKHASDECSKKNGINISKQVAKKLLKYIFLLMAAHFSFFFFFLLLFSFRVAVKRSKLHFKYFDHKKNSINLIT